ncbi:ATP-binding protein [Streptomyces sp. NPDC006879]|uniref:ATP-binding protein n=1 Tax=Streptomyces sp. NPDC006879 TaxID=3364767 RepID=UPI0036B5D9BE
MERIPGGGQDAQGSEKALGTPVPAGRSPLESDRATGAPGSKKGDGERAPTPPPARAAGPVRAVALVSGDFTVLVNPVDGSEIEPNRPGAAPPAPAKRDGAGRAELTRAGRPPKPPGPEVTEAPLLGRSEERAELVRLLGRGRSVRLCGSSGAGRSRLLEAVAADCAELAPDGVVRLSGYRQSPADLLYALFATVYQAPNHRPDRAELQTALRGIGAIVVVDDLEFGGSGLEELLLATPECAFLFAATPAVPAAPATCGLEEYPLGGLDRLSSMEMLEQAIGRPLQEAERDWAADLWFASEGLPLRFVQAAALLRARDALLAPPSGAESAREPEVFEGTALDAVPGEVPLPTSSQGSAPVTQLTKGLSDFAQEALRLAVALGGEVVHHAHLPALTGDTDSDTAVGELLDSGLITAAGAHYRLAAGVLDALEEAGHGAEGIARALAVAQHYAWWTGHCAVTPERVLAEADAILAALSALVAEPDEASPSAAVLLARTAAPVFAGGLQWGPWERILRYGQEAARRSGQVAEEAYFHHELGILALCQGQLDRARVELDASIAMRGALADRRGTVAGRRALALVDDRSGELPVPAPRVQLPGAGPRNPVDMPPVLSPPGQGAPRPYQVATTAVLPPVPGRGGAGSAGRTTPMPAGGRGPHGARPQGAPPARRSTGGSERNVVAAAAGALLVAVLGTVLALGMNTDGDTTRGRPSDRYVTGDDGVGTLPTGDEPQQEQPTPELIGTRDRTPAVPAVSAAPVASASTSPSAIPSGSPSPSAATPSASAGSKTPSSGVTSPTSTPVSPTGKATEPTGTPSTSAKPPVETTPVTPPTQATPEASSPADTATEASSEAEQAAT